MIDNTIRQIGTGLSLVPSVATQLASFSKRKPLGAIGGGLLIALVLIGALAPLISPQDPYKPHADAIYAGFSSAYPLGGDEVGRDVLSRLFQGARTSMYVGLASVAIGITLGTAVGVISAYAGGKFDLLIQRVVDAFLAFPIIILGLGVMSVLGASVNNVILALVIIFVPRTARTIRAQALSLKEMEYVTAARAVGCPPVRIILRHIVPNLMSTYIILATVTLGLAITTEAALSFLGIGVPPDVPTWGSMLRVAANAFIGVSPTLAIFPGVAIALAVFGANLLGDALRDVLDPRLRGS
jgi:peptide/nickel transport system permease protein